MQFDVATGLDRESFHSFQIQATGKGKRCSQIPVLRPEGANKEDKINTIFMIIINVGMKMSSFFCVPHFKELAILYIDSFQLGGLVK